MLICPVIRHIAQIKDRIDRNIEDLVDRRENRRRTDDSPPVIIHAVDRPLDRMTRCGRSCDQEDILVSDHHFQILAEDHLACHIILGRNDVHCLMRVLGENTGLCQFFGKISADDVHSVEAHDRVDNGRSGKILAEQFLCLTARHGWSLAGQYVAHALAKVLHREVLDTHALELLSDAKAAVLVDYRGLTVEQDTALRKQLRAEGVTYKVYKNTMLNLAFKGTEFEPMSAKLEGPTAMAVSATDSSAPARILAEFAKKNQALELKAGVIEGNYYDEKGIQVMATIPSREVLLGRLLGSIQSPITNLARVLNQIAESKEA